MNHQKILTTVALVAFSLQLAACSALKPDHPQVRESFEKRRAPRDNMMAANGTLVEQKASNFQSINPTRVIDNRAPAEALKVPANVPPSVTNIIQQPPTAAPSSSGSSGQTGNFFERLWKKISYAQPTQNIQVAVNVIPETEIEQGSASNSYSYYEMANEVLPAHPVHAVKEAKIRTISSDFGYLTSPEGGYNIINAAQAVDAPVMPTPPVAPAPAAPPPPAPPSAPAPEAPMIQAPTPSAAAPTPPPVNTPVVPLTQAPVASTEPAPQAPELPRMEPSSAPVVPAAPKPMPTHSAPMPKAPHVPSNEHIKSSTQNSQEPELNQVPPKPNEQPKAEEAPKVHKKKLKKHHKKVAHPTKESGDPYTERPIPAEISRQLNGDEKVTGYLK